MKLIFRDIYGGRHSILSGNSTKAPLTRAQAVVHANVWLIKSLGNPRDAMSNMDDKMDGNHTQIFLLTGCVLHLDKHFPIHR